MNEQNYMAIFTNLKNNSIGINKRSSNKRNLKKVILNASMASILITFLSGCSVGLKNSNSNNYTNDKIVEESNLYGYEKGFLKQVEKENAIRLLKHNNLTEYKIVDGKRQYNYSVDDYKNIYRLTDSYLHGFYLLTTKETFNKVLNARGYEDLNEFLINNGYVNEQGQPDINLWEKISLEKRAEELNSYTTEEEVHQR